jgi:CubicO group peptidase (beta-lactamase class C family)
MVRFRSSLRDGALAAALATAAFATCTQQPHSGSLESRVAAYVEPYARTNNFSGVILITKDGRPLVRRGYGQAIREFDVPVTPETKFQVASVSKSFTAAAILFLEQQGKLQTSDPLDRFIPGYPSGGRLTLHHLLAHTSGIPNVNALPDYDAKSRFPHGLEEILSWFKDKPLDFEPGARYAYSNSNYNVLASVIERVSGKSYGAFLEEAIFRPLGMNDTAHHGDAENVIPRLAAGYAPAGGDAVERAPYLDWSVKTGNGSLYTTADDLAKWDRALYGDALLNETSRKKSFAEHTEGVGYGWFVRRGKHSSLASNGRAPGFTASIERFTDDRICVIVLSNLYSSIGQSMAADIAAIVFGEDRKPLIPVTPIKIAEIEIGRCLGRYRFGQDFSFNPGLVAEIKRDGPWLVLVGSGGAGTSYLVPIGEGRFIDRAYGGIVTFDTDAGGKAAGLTWNFGRDYRAARMR